MLTLALLSFWIAVGALAYVYAGYPLLLALVASLVRRTKPAPGYTPHLSILIAAYNEEASIGRKIEQTLGLDYPADKLEILVLSDGSTDRTNEIVRSFDDPRVRLLDLQPRRGKTAAQNQGVLEARGEVLVFSDATTIYHPQALRYLACNYQDPQVGAVSGKYQYFDPEGNSPTGLGTIAFWNYENLLKTLQSRIATISGCCGCIYSVRRAVYTRLSEELSSDLVQPLRVLEKGYRVVFEDRGLAYEETTRHIGAEFAMRVRVISGGMWGIFCSREVLKPWKFPWITFQLFSHKILRWFVPFFLLLLLLSSAVLAHHPFYRAVLLLQIFFYLWALASMAIPFHRSCRILWIPLYYCVLNIAAFCSFFELVRGNRYATWETLRT